MQNKNIIWQSIIRSYIWIVLPSCIFCSIYSYSYYVELGTYLTPHSINVRSYTRSNGVCVRPYNRRPPWGIKHDEPYENLRFWMAFLIILSIIIGSGNVLYCYMKTTEDYLKYHLAIENEKNREKAIEKEAQKNIILSNIRFDFPQNKPWPRSLFISDGSIRCKFCLKLITRDDFYISYKAIKHLHYVCIPCASDRKTIGRNQPSSIYINEVIFADKVKKRLDQFIKDFIIANKPSSIEFSISEIKCIFITEVKKHCAFK